MGTIRGDIPVLGVANLLQSLALNKCVGHLTCESAHHQKVFFVHTGGLRLVCGSKRCQRLEQFLRRIGPVNREETGKIVLEWTLEEMSDLFGWTRGTFRFQEGVELPRGVTPLQGLAGLKADTDVMTAILEAARRVDLLPRILETLPDPESVPARPDPAAAVDEAGLQPEVLRDVLPLVDGMRSVAQIIQTSAFPRLSVLEALYRLTLQGTLSIRIPEAA
jgi:hypothetical protein